MRVAFLAIALMGLVVGANAGAVDLTSANFDAEVLESGKAAFVKFLAPWCVSLTSSRASNPRGLYSPISAAPHPAAGNPRVDRSTPGAHTPTPRGRIDRPVAPPSLYTARHDRARFGTTPIDPRVGIPDAKRRLALTARGAVFFVFFGFFVKRIADPFPSPCPSTGEATASR